MSRRLARSFALCATLGFGCAAPRHVMTVTEPATGAKSAYATLFVDGARVVVSRAPQTANASFAVWFREAEGPMECDATLTTAARVRAATNAWWVLLALLIQTSGGDMNAVYWFYLPPALMILSLLAGFAIPIGHFMMGKMIRNAKPGGEQ